MCSTEGVPSASRSNRASQYRRLLFSRELTEVDGRGTFADISFKQMVPASLMSLRRGRWRGDFEEPPSDKTKMAATVSSVRRAVRKADLETCMAGIERHQYVQTLHQDYRSCVRKYLLSSGKSSEGHIIPTANACHVRCWSLVEG